MPEQRLNIDNVIDKIHKEMGFGSFMEWFLEQIMTGDSMARIYSRCPVKLSVNRLMAVLKLIKPEAVEVMEMPTAQRRPEIRKMFATDFYMITTYRTERNIVDSLFNAEHPLFKYFSQEWYRKFNSQRAMAKARQVPWEFDFATWITWWVTSGKIEERGLGNGYQMCRRNDTGPYSWDNCYCARGNVNRDHAREFKRTVEVVE